MNTKRFSPATFVNKFKKETGLNDVPDFEDKDAARSFLEDAIRDGDLDKKSRYQNVLSAQGIAIAIGDQSKLTQCLKDVKFLAKSCPLPEKYQGIFLMLFYWIKMVDPLLYSERYRKSFYRQLRKKEERLLAKKKTDDLGRIYKAIDTIKTLNPDPSRFDEAYLRKLAQEKEFKPSEYLYQLRLKSNDDVLLARYEHRQMLDYGTIPTQLYKRKNPKGYESIRVFTYAIHDLLRRHKSKLTDSVICSRIASLLKIIADKEKCSRQNIQNILARRTKNPEIPTPAK